MEKPKQTSIYLTDNDLNKLNRIKEVYESQSNTEAIRTLIKAEYLNIQKYESMKL